MNALEDSKLWKKCCKIGEIMHAFLGSLPEDENYPMGYKCRQYSFDVSSCVAEAIGSIDPRDKVWQLGRARSVLFAAKDAYKQASQKNYIKLDPDFMVLVEEATVLIDEEIEACRKDIPRWYKEMSIEEAKR